MYKNGPDEIVGPVPFADSNLFWYVCTFLNDHVRSPSNRHPQGQFWWCRHDKVNVFDKVIVVILPSACLPVILHSQRLQLPLRAVGQSRRCDRHFEIWGLLLQHGAEKNPKVFAVSFQALAQQPITYH